MTPETLNYFGIMKHYKKEVVHMVTQKEQGKSTKGDKKPLRKVQFEFSAPEAKEVFLAGDFNNWDTQLDLMKKDRKGTWKATFSLMPGRYEYQFFVDSNWVNDPSCLDCTPNEFGSKNCVKVVE
jgi:1,4-alpha-glucan branching enzyme